MATPEARKLRTMFKQHTYILNFRKVGLDSKYVDLSFSGNVSNNVFRHFDITKDLGSAKAGQAVQ